MRTARLLFRLYRFEVLSVLIASALLAGAGLYVSSRLSAALGSGTDRLVQWQEFGPGELSAECEVLAQDFFGINEDEAGKVMAAMAILPFAAGLLIGVPLIGREIEHTTAGLAWSLQGSRGRWLIKRALIAALALGLVLAVPAATAEILEGWRQPWVDPATTTFDDYGLRGPLTVFRGLAALGIGIVTGATIGRVLPALITGFVAVLALVWILTTTQWAFLPEPEYVSDEGLGSEREGGIFVSQGFRDRAGNILTYEKAAALSPYGDRTQATDEWLFSEFESVSGFISGERLGIVVVRESIALSVLAVALVGATAVVVSRRRPY